MAKYISYILYTRMKYLGFKTLNLLPSIILSELRTEYLDLGQVLLTTRLYTSGCACIILRLSAKLFVLLGLISGCNESSGISVLSYTTMLPYMSIFECASCLEA